MKKQKKFFEKDSSPWRGEMKKTKYYKEPGCLPAGRQGLLISE
jgi:hypothetical protein